MAKDATRSPPTAPRRAGLAAVACALALVTAAAYWPVLGAGFVYDDEQYVVLNRHVQQGITPSSLRWAFMSFHQSNWHPLTWVSHMLDVAAFGLDPRGHHAANLALHLANAALLLLALTRLTGAAAPSAAVAALFALHPLHVESVAWVAERKDLLSVFFGLLALLSYAAYARRPGRLRYAAVAVCFALGLLAKPMLVTLPFVLLLFDFWPLGRLGGARPGARGAGFPAAPARRVLLEKAPLLALSAAASVVTYLAQARAGSVTDPLLYPLSSRVLNALTSYAAYIGKTFAPRDLAVFYPHPGAAVAIGPAVAAGVALAAATLLAFALRKRRPYLVTGWLTYLGTLVPVIGLVQVGTQAMADRYTYLPLTGLFVALAWGLRDIAARRRRGTAALAALAAAALVLLAVLTRAQTRHWKSGQSLFTHALEATRDNWLAHGNLGVLLYEQGRVGEAIDQYSRAIAIKPTYPQAHNNLGNALLNLGLDERAAGHFREALRLMPDLAEAHGNLGLALARQGHYVRAIEEFRESLRLEPGYVEDRVHLGQALLATGGNREAAEQFRRALEQEPLNAEAGAGLGLASARLGER